LTPWRRVVDERASFGHLRVIGMPGERRRGRDITEARGKLERARKTAQT